MIDQRPLVLEADTDEPVVGEPVTIRARDWNKPVEGVTVSSHTETAVTDESGRCQLTLRAPGFWKITAIKSPDEYVAYRPTTVLVRAISKAASRGRVQRLATHYG
ncbi:DUF4198 domain-containing protein [Natrononativus amylolyticus]|uniref:DUF4198 domain-containing protein n=1 Tax=Natrononativus amylolyticus TaxID=2963434 RepID=UPI0020CF1C80|nr:DUF4198 domain-containing protein [Natrononativus amylolyticus]